MNRPLLLAVAAASLLASAAHAQTPVDTYFALAVTENGSNHVGARLLYLDFQSSPSTPNQANGVIACQPGTITIDGDSADWAGFDLTTIHGLALNNYPLSMYIDDVPTDITVGAAWDATYIYFLVEWEDAGHTASNRADKWLFGDQGGGETGWNPQVHRGATAGAPNASAVNASGHVLLGNELEDMVILEFPIIDAEGNFVDGGPGCGMYCHPALAQGFPWQNYTGLGTLGKYTNTTGDKCDLWKWRSTATRPAGYADDRYIANPVPGTKNGRFSDPSGVSCYSGNVLVGGNPEFMHSSGLSYTGNVLQQVDAVAFSGTPAQGDQIPRYMSRAASGDRGDIEATGRFDGTSKVWTVEFRRALTTGNSDDRDFRAGSAAAAPTNALVTAGNPAAGQALYDIHCISCHLTAGIGEPGVDDWNFPRIQRTCASSIVRELAINPDMANMPIFSAQQIEDMSAYMQAQQTFLPMHTLSVSVVGPSSGTAVISSPSGIDCPGTSCSFEYTEGAPITLLAQAPAGWIFDHWSGDGSGTSPYLPLTLSTDLSVTATFRDGGIDNPSTYVGPVRGAVVTYPATAGLALSASGLTPGKPVLVLAGPVSRAGVTSTGMTVLARRRANAKGGLMLPLQPETLRSHNGGQLQVIDVSTRRSSDLVALPIQ